MKVLFQNRADALTNWGGDTTQMMQTKEALSKLRVDVEINLETEPDLNGYDLVHIFNIQTGDQGIRQLLNAKKQGIPVVLSTIYWDKRHIERSTDYFKYHRSRLIRLLAAIHDRIPYLLINSPLSTNRRRIFKAAHEMLIQADLLLPNSFAELEILALLFDSPCVRAKALIVPNGINTVQTFDSSKANPLLSDLPSEYVLEVGRLEPVKGQLSLIESLMDNPDIPLVFIGRGIDSVYGRKCQLVGSRRGNVYFIPHVPHDQLRDFYQRAKVHALPSLRESPGLVTLEAAVAGANCVVSIHGPVTEYFGSDVWYCDPEKSESIKKAVSGALKSPRNMKLKERIEKYFTWDEAARITHIGYKQVLAGIKKNPTQEWL